MNKEDHTQRFVTHALELERNRKIKEKKYRKEPSTESKKVYLSFHLPFFSLFQL
jgi:hypothetical protein